MKTKRPSIYWLEEFGLSLKQLTMLGRLKVKLHVYLRHVNEKSLFRFTPSQRARRTREHYDALFSQVEREWRDGPIQVTRAGREPRGFIAVVEARRVSGLLRLRGIGSIWIDGVAGRKRKESKPKQRWHAIQARFAIQIEGQTSGLQTYEDRIVMVKAFDVEDAKRRLRPGFKEYGKPYLNPYGFMVRWKFERILDICEIVDEEIDPIGGEIFSVLKQRRVKPEFVWRTKRKSRL